VLPFVQPTHPFLSPRYPVYPITSVHSLGPAFYTSTPTSSSTSPLPAPRPAASSPLALNMGSPLVQGPPIPTPLGQLLSARGGRSSAPASPLPGTAGPLYISQPSGGTAAARNNVSAGAALRPSPLRATVAVPVATRRTSASAANAATAAPPPPDATAPSPLAASVAADAVELGASPPQHTPPPLRTLAASVSVTLPSHATSVKAAGNWDHELRSPGSAGRRGNSAARSVASASAPAAQEGILAASVAAAALLAAMPLGSGPNNSEGTSGISSSAGGESVAASTAATVATSPRASVGDVTQTPPSASFSGALGGANQSFSPAASMVAMRAHKDTDSPTATIPPRLRHTGYPAANPAAELSEAKPAPYPPAFGTSAAAAADFPPPAPRVPSGRRFSLPAVPPDVVGAANEAVAENGPPAFFSPPVQRVGPPAVTGIPPGPISSYTRMHRQTMAAASGKASRESIRDPHVARFSVMGPVTGAPP